MQLAERYARFLPIDPGYRPFGVGVLRGLNVAHFALVGFVGLLFGVESLMFEEAAAGPALLRLLAQTGVTVVLFTPMLVFVTLADNLSARWGAGRRIALLAVAMLLGAVVHALTWPPSACRAGGFEFWREDCNVLAFDWGKTATLARAALWGTLFTALLYFYKRDAEVAHRLHETHVRRLDLERQETEARLRSLQAQIEPHFLFNTLAHIQRLLEVRPEGGRAMLRDLIDYLRSALPRMREPESTLGRELSLARAFLNVHRIRMGDRLRVEIEAPHELLDARLPPMMVLTLAENAIKHGLGPKREGGMLSIVARAVDDRLEVEVRDDGVGLTLGAGAGSGLSNTRARLSTMFGDRGALHIGNGAAGGVRAVLALPLALGAS